MSPVAVVGCVVPLRASVGLANAPVTAVISTTQQPARKYTAQSTTTMKTHVTHNISTSISIITLDLYAIVASRGRVKCYTSVNKWAYQLSQMNPGDGIVS